MVERCPSCAMRFEREPASFIGAYFLNFLATELALIIWIGLMFAFTLPQAPLGIIVAGGILICIVVPLAGYPFSKSTWAALHLAMAPLDPDEEADAAVFRFERGDAGAP